MKERGALVNQRMYWSMCNMLMGSKMRGVNSEAFRPNDQTKPKAQFLAAWHQRINYNAQKNMWTWPSISHINLSHWKTNPKPNQSETTNISSLTSSDAYTNPKPDSTSIASNPNILFYSAWKHMKSKDKT